MPPTYPNGFPALKQAKARFFRFEGFEYTTPSDPTAGGTAEAQKIPMTPENTSIYIAALANPAITNATVNPAMLVMNIIRRPNISATFPNANRNAPLVSLLNQGLEVMYE